MKPPAAAAEAHPRTDTAALDVAKLSPAETRVLEHVLRGRSARQIAEELVLSEATVRSHLSRIYSKLGVAGQVELLAMASSGHRRREAAATSPQQTARSEVRAPAWLPIAALVVPIAVLAIAIPPVSLAVGPGLLIAAWAAGRAAEGGTLRAARGLLIIAGIVVTAWAALVILSFVALAPATPSLERV